MTIAEPVITLQHVALSFGKRVILRDANMAIQQGEFVVVLGPNGAGKSTLFKMLLGLIQPTAGEIRVLGRAPRSGNKEIGYAPQHRTVEGDLALRARDLVGFGLDGNRWGFGLPSRKRDAIIDQALEEVDALRYANAPVGQLSGGEQQRLLIAQALLTNPRILLLDEPLASLDIARQQDIVTLVGNVCRSRGVTVLLVAHDVNPLLPVLDRIVYIANGQSLIGTPGEVITSENLSKLYKAPVEVVHALDRIFVVGAEV
ncbi:metal ABC transporter ATP-binding protein [Ktedonobacter robiniae]|nr:ABC transporter ATP-binding protein [Ktedonobacter robiniae]